MRGDLEGGVRVFSRGIEKASVDERILLNRGIALLELGQPSQGCEDLRKQHP